jgi:hypothetical protein
MFYAESSTGAPPLDATSSIKPLCAVCGCHGPLRLEHLSLCVILCFIGVILYFQISANDPL